MSNILAELNQTSSDYLSPSAFTSFSVKHRPELKLAADRLIKVNDHVGLHPSLKSAASLLEDGLLVIVQGVGYPNPNRLVN